MKTKKFLSIFLSLVIVMTAILPALTSLPSRAADLPSGSFYTVSSMSATEENSTDEVKIKIDYYPSVMYVGDEGDIYAIWSSDGGDSYDKPCYFRCSDESIIDMSQANQSSTLGRMKALSPGTVTIRVSNYSSTGNICYEEITITVKERPVTTTTAAPKPVTTTTTMTAYIVSSKYYDVTVQPTAAINRVTATKTYTYSSINNSFDTGSIDVNIDYTLESFTGGGYMEYLWSDGRTTEEYVPLNPYFRTYSTEISLSDLSNLQLSYSSPKEAYDALASSSEDIDFDLEFSGTIKSSYFINAYPYDNLKCSGTIPIHIYNGLGDVNSDGKIDALDASYVLSEYAKPGQLTSSQQSIADVNKDGKIDALDASSILHHYTQASIGLTPSFLDNGNFASGANNGFSDDEITGAPFKASIEVGTVKASIGDEVTVPISVNNASWGAIGLHVLYDDTALELVKAKWSDDVAYSNAFGVKNIQINDGNVFFTASGTDNVEISDLAYLTFEVKNPCSASFSPVTIEYQEGDLFTTYDNSESGRLMQAYAFTQGITNGGVEVIETTEPTPSDKPMIIPTNLTMNPGDTSTILTINVPEGKTVSWTSDNTKVATVSNGIVTAIGEGTATIYAICGNSLMSCTVRVTDNSITYGDANGDGKLSISDAVKIMSYASNPAKNPLENADCCDVYNRGDGVDAMDSLSVQKRLINVISVLPESFM